MFDIRSIPQSSIRTEWTQVSLDNCEGICSDFVALDIETTGLDSQKDAIIEVAAIKFEKGVAVSSYEALINAGVPVSEGAYNVNHISDSMLAEYGKDPDDVYSELGEYLSDVLNGKSYLCAHFAGFDLSFLAPALDGSFYEGCIRYVDTWTLARDTIKHRDIPNYKLQTLATYLHVPDEAKHRALSDAMVCGKILIKLLSMRKGQLEVERYIHPVFTETELETYAVIIRILRDNRNSTQDIAITKNASGIIDVWDYCESKVLFKYKHAKRASNVVVKSEYDDGTLHSKDCPASEGEDNVRLFFSNPFELEECADMFDDIYRNLYVDYLSLKREDSECLCMYEIEKDLEKHYLHALLRWNHEGHWIYEERPTHRVSFLTAYETYPDKKEEADDKLPEMPDPELQTQTTSDERTISSSNELSQGGSVSTQENSVDNNVVENESSAVSSETNVSEPELPASNHTMVQPVFENDYETNTVKSTYEQPTDWSNNDSAVSHDDIVYPYLDEDEGNDENIEYDESSPNVHVVSHMDSYDRGIHRSDVSAEYAHQTYGKRRSLLRKVMTKIPGFRSGNIIHAVVAVVVYAFIIWMVFSVEWADRNQLHGVALLWINRLCILGYFASMVDILTGNNGPASRLPLLHSKYVLLKILGYGMAIITIPFVWALIAVILEIVIES